MQFFTLTLLVLLGLTSNTAQAGDVLFTLKIAEQGQDRQSVRSSRSRLEIRHLGGFVLVMPSPDGEFHVHVTDVTNLPPSGGLFSFAPKLTAKLEQVGTHTLLLTTSAPGAASTPSVRPEEPFFTAEEGVLTINGADVSMGSGVVLGDADAPAQSTGRPQANLMVLVPMAQMDHLSVVSNHGHVEITKLDFRGRKDDHILHARTSEGLVTLRDCRNATAWTAQSGVSTRGKCFLRLATMGYDEKLASLFNE